eukprot:2016787-Rhodomonas_salina.1
MSRAQSTAACAGLRPPVTQHTQTAHLISSSKLVPLLAHSDPPPPLPVQAQTWKEAQAAAPSVMSSWSTS